MWEGRLSAKVTAEKLPAMERAQQAKCTASAKVQGGTALRALKEQNEGAPHSWRTRMFNEGEVGSGKNEVEEETSSQVIKDL